MSDEPAPDPIFEPLTRSGAVEQARRYIKMLIDLRRVKPGEQLPSATAISAKVGVSRPAVLQALKILESEGRITVRPGRAGARVQPIEGAYLDACIVRVWERRDTWIELNTYREIMEPGIVRVVAQEGLADDEVAEARRLLAAMKEADDPADYRALDVEFHRVFARATGKKVLEALAALGRQAIADVFLIVPLTPERRRSSDREHERLLNAVVAGDARAAAEIAHRHVLTTNRRIAQALAGELGAAVLPSQLHSSVEKAGP